MPLFETPSFLLFICKLHQLNYSQIMYFVSFILPNWARELTKCKQLKYVRSFRRQSITNEVLTRKFSGY